MSPHHLRIGAPDRANRPGWRYRTNTRRTFTAPWKAPRARPPSPSAHFRGKNARQHPSVSRGSSSKRRSG